MENFEEVITLVDEDGSEVEFELVMTIEANDNNYAILAPLEPSEDEDEDEAFIFRVEEDENGEMVLEPIEDEEEYAMVVAVYETLVEE